LNRIERVGSVVKDNLNVASIRSSGTATTRTHASSRPPPEEPTSPSSNDRRAAECAPAPSLPESELVAVAFDSVEALSLRLVGGGGTKTVVVVGEVCV